MTDVAKTDFVAKNLQELASVFSAKNKEYGDGYRHFGDVLLGYFPRGVTLASSEEFNRFALFVLGVVKDMRYANNILNGGHVDSLDDKAIYAQMQQHCDHIAGMSANISAKIQNDLFSAKEPDGFNYV